MPALETNDIQQIKNLPLRRKIGIGVAFVALFFIGVYLATGFSGGLKKAAPIPTTVQKNVPTVTPKPYSRLQIVVPNTTVTKGQAVPVSVAIDKEPAQAVDVVLTYDANVFTASNIVMGTAFPNPIRKLIQPGKVLVSASLTPETQNVKANGTIFTVTLTAKAAVTDSQIGFDPKDTIVAVNGKNILGAVEPVKVTVK